jgi:tight adherence protein B
MLILMALTVFSSVTLFGYAAATWLRERAAARHAMARRLDRMAGGSRADIRQSVLKDQRLSSIAFLNALLGRTPLVIPAVRVIRQAGLNRRVGEVLLYVPLLACMVLLVNQIVGGPLVFGVVGALVAGALPFVVVLRLRKKRTARFAEQLADALDLIRSALQAGHGFSGAMAVAADTFPDPIGYELHYVVEEMRLGLPMRDALYNLSQRVPDTNLHILTVGVLVATESGGNLAEVMFNLAHTIRERFKLARELRVLTAQGRMSGTLLTVLPFAVGMLLFLTNREYFGPMFVKHAGHMMLLYAALSLMWGHIVIRRLIQFKG